MGAHVCPVLDHLHIQSPHTLFYHRLSLLMPIHTHKDSHIPAKSGPVFQQQCQHKNSRSRHGAVTNRWPLLQQQLSDSKVVSLTTANFRPCIPRVGVPVDERCGHFRSHNFTTLPLAACTTLLHTDTRAEVGEPQANCTAV